MLSYHLWVIPSGRAHDLLAGTIVKLSDQYRSPCFSPHVTLLGHLPGTEAEILSRAKMLARRLRPFQIDLTKAGTTDQYFQCLFLYVDCTVAIRDAHIQAVTMFSMADASPYTPHLSLMYGHFPGDLREQAASALPTSLKLEFVVNRLEVIRAGSEDPPDWITIESIPFGQGSTAQ
jgi:2'-5' RNA ligase